MKEYLSVSFTEEIEEKASEVIEIYEDPPDEADPENDDDPYIGEDGILVVETDELEIYSDFSLDDFPEELSFPVNFIGWGETEERMAAAHGLESHSPANVTIRLQKKWRDVSGRSKAIYKVTAEHDT